MGARARPERAGDAANLALDVRRLYFQDYLRQWDDLLADLTVVPITNVTQAADVLRILSGPTSPFRKLLGQWPARPTCRRATGWSPRK